MDKKTTGAIAGGVLGGVAGTQVGKGKGRILAVLVGAAAGAYIGSKIGERLEERDQKKMSEATKKAAETGKSQSFSNPDTGVQGKAEVVSRSTQAVQSTDKQVTERECQVIKQTVITKDGKEAQENVTLCRGPQGWEVAA
jgi:surface antigen